MTGRHSARPQARSQAARSQAESDTAAFDQIAPPADAFEHPTTPQHDPAEQPAPEHDPIPAYQRDPFAHDPFADRAPQPDALEDTSPGHGEPFPAIPHQRDPFEDTAFFRNQPFEDDPYGPAGFEEGAPGAPGGDAGAAGYDGDDATAPDQAPRRRRRVLPIATGAAIAAVIAGSAYGAIQLSSAPAARSEAAPTSAPATTDSPSPLPTSASPSPTHRVVPTRANRASARPLPVQTSARPTPKPAPSTQQAGGNVTSSGYCGASYYASGTTTADGETFNPDAYTAASKTLPFNTQVRVTNPQNGKSVVVRINDRGPYVSGRCLDLTRAAFEAIAPLSQGVLDTVRWEVLG